MQDQPPLNTRQSLVSGMRLLIGIPGQLLGLVLLLTPLCIVFYVAGWLMLVTGVNELINIYQWSEPTTATAITIIIVKICAALPVAFILSYVLTPFAEGAGNFFSFFFRFTYPDFKNENHAKYDRYEDQPQGYIE